MSGGEDGSARMMHVQNKRVVGTLVHCDAGAVRTRNVFFGGERRSVVWNKSRSQGLPSSSDRRPPYSCSAAYYKTPQTS